MARAVNELNPLVPIIGKRGQGVRGPNAVERPLAKSATPMVSYAIQGG